MARVFHDRNKEICPDDNIRLYMVLEQHFCERLFQRFGSVDGANLVKQLLRWIDKNYCDMLFDNALGERKEYIATLGNGKVAMILFQGTLRIRTCYKS